MLSLQTVYPDTLELLKQLAQTSILQDMRLVGGTSLALQYGHRRSVDLDFFGRTTDDAVMENGLILASPKDIAVMKVNAIIGQGTKKDFVDIYFLLCHFSFEQLMQFYLEKYPDGSEYRALLSMTYFYDADPQPMPYMFDNISWQQIKDIICIAVEQYNQKHS